MPEPRGAPPALRRQTSSSEPASSVPISPSGDPAAVKKLGALVASVTEQANRVALGAIVEAVRSAREASPAGGRVLDQAARAIGRVALETAAAVQELGGRLELAIGNASGSGDRSPEADAMPTPLADLAPLLTRTRALPAALSALAPPPGPGEAGLHAVAGELTRAIDQLDRFCADFRISGAAA